VELSVPGNVLQSGYLVAPLPISPTTFWVCGEPNPAGP
jgi:hypothetical protein